MVSALTTVAVIVLFRVTLPSQHEPRLWVASTCMMPFNNSLTLLLSPPSVAEPQVMTWMVEFLGGKQLRCGALDCAAEYGG